MPEDNTYVIQVLEQALSLIRRSPGLAKGRYSIDLRIGECYCLVGAIHRADRTVFSSLSDGNTLAKQELRYRTRVSALDELAQTIRQLDSNQLRTSSSSPDGCVIAYNDKVLLKDRNDGDFDPAAKLPALALIRRTINRLRSSQDPHEGEAS